MDEIISGERKEKLKAFFVDVIDADVLTNGDALKIIEKKQKACENRKAVLYEDLVVDLIEGGDDTEVES